MERSPSGKLEEAVSCLLKVATFCAENSQLCNIHTVDFITGNKWNILLPRLREELDELNMEQLQALTNHDVPYFLTERDTPHLFHFISAAKAHTLEALKICSSPSAVLPLFSEARVAKKSSYWCMSPKKNHEVEAVASVISPLAYGKGVKVVVDVGSGKGYLSSYLALEHRLNVLAIDSSDSNTLQADKRNKKVLYHWKKSCKKKNALLNMKSKTFSSIFDSSKSYETRQCSQSLETSNNFQNTDHSSWTVNSPGVFVPRTHHINSRSDLSHLIDDFLFLLNKENISLKNVENDTNSCATILDDQILLCSLHGCGNLSASLLKLFISTPQAKILCCVGCCYHLIEETFFKSPFSTSGSEESQEFGFPLSTVLLKNKYQLGRNARMLASQSIDRISAEQTEPKKALYYRALLEVILKDKLGEISLSLNVGHIAAKCSGFFAYVQRALKELKLNHLQLSESDVEQYLLEYYAEEKKLYAVQQLRIIMAPCIEGLLLLDRLVFLLEQETIQEAHLIRLFDPIISPRCYGVIAWK